MDKTERVAVVGVISIVWITALNLIPKLMGEYAVNTYYIIELSFVCFISLSCGVFLLKDLNHWAFSVIRFIALSNAIWYLSGTCIEIANLWVPQEVINSFVDETLHDRIELVFSFGLISTIFYELWKSRKSYK